MAKFQLTGAWPVGQWLIPAGTMLDTRDWKWNGIKLPWPPPPNSQALDQEGYDALFKLYGYKRVLSSPGDPEINRHGDPKKEK